MVRSPVRKELYWVGSSLNDLREFPSEVKKAIGYALAKAQEGGKSPDVKPLKGFGGAGVLEVVATHDGNTFRAVYTVRLANAVYVLHAFQKKSKRGISTPKSHIDLIRQRLKQAEEHYHETHLKQ